MAQQFSADQQPMLQWIKQFGLADVAMNQFAQTGIKMFGQLGQAMGQAAANAIVFGSNFGKAMEQALKSTLASIAGKAITRALYFTALGFGYLALQDYKDADLSFEAAGLFAAIGGAAAGIGAAIPGGGGAGGSGSGAGAGGGTSRSAPSTTSGTARGLSGYAGSAQTNVHIYLNGPMTPQVWQLVAPSIIDAVNSAVSNGSAQLLATTTTRAPNRTAGR